MKITVNGREVEAYDLIMQKANALDIISGKKTLEIRPFSDHYNQMFTDQKILDKNERLREEGRDDECTEPLKDVEYVRFRNRDHSWSLIVKIDMIGMCSMCEEDIDMLNEDFNFHDYDNEWQQYNSLPFEEKPMFYYLHPCEIIARTGI